MMDFIFKYWRIILEAFCLLVSFVLFIIRKRPIKIVDSVKALIIAALPEIINRVENYKDPFDPLRKLSGQEKLTMALSIVQTYLIDECGLSEEDLSLYHWWIVEHIEAILSTPQKKGENTNE